MFIVSVDGGATKTIAVCYDDQGTLQGIGVSGPSNFRNVGVEEAGRNLKNATEKSIERSGLDIKDISRYSFALAGVKDSAKSTEDIRNMIGHLSLSAPIMLLNDAEAGFNCRFPGSDGIVAAPGTGMIAYARHGGLVERTSGWGWFIGDEGGAFYTARNAIEKCSKFYDGRITEDSELPAALMKYFNIDEPRKLVNEIYKERTEIRRIAGFTTVVSEMSKRGDRMAVEIIEKSAVEAALAVIALKRTYFDGIDVVFSGYGGVFRAGELYWSTLLSRVKKEYPHIKYKPPLFGYHAVLGSIYLILKDMNLDSSFDLAKSLDALNLMIHSLPKQEKEDYLFIQDE